MSDFFWLAVDFIRDPRFTIPHPFFALSILAMFAWAAASYRLPRRHVDRFAARQRVVVTPENGALIARALAISFRWRRFGLACGVVISVVVGMYVALPYPLHFRFNYGIMLLGWFAGALAGEWRIASKPVAVGERRSAGLATRSVASYVTRSNRVVLGVVLVILFAVVGYSLFVDWILAGGDVPWLSLALVTTTTGLLWATFRRIVQRPQPFIDDATRQADDALRGHSLTVLVGCVIAAAGWLMLNVTTGALGRFPFIVPAAVLGGWVASR